MAGSAWSDPHARARCRRCRKLTRLEWIADAANGASLRLAERIGFTPARMLPGHVENRDGTFSDAVLAVMRETR